MSLIRFILISLLGWGLVGCASERYVSSNQIDAAKKATNTEWGVRYLLGQGVPQNNEKAFHYFKAAADDDDPFAENEIAFMYAVGKGTSQNDEKALDYYQQAANHGLSSAQYNLALMYLYGLGTEPNRNLAIRWLKKSAAHGFEPAKNLIDVIHANAT